jgi:hypothetical protein
VGERGGAAVTVGSAVGDRTGVGVGVVVVVDVGIVVGVDVDVVGILVAAVGVWVAAATTSVDVASGRPVGSGVGPQAARATGRSNNKKLVMASAKVLFLFICRIRFVILIRPFDAESSGGLDG